MIPEEDQYVEQIGKGVNQPARSRNFLDPKKTFKILDHVLTSFSSGRKKSTSRREEWSVLSCHFVLAPFGKRALQRNLANQEECLLSEIVSPKEVATIATHKPPGISTHKPPGRSTIVTASTMFCPIQAEQQSHILFRTNALCRIEHHSLICFRLC